jgi:hypothetical protein
MAKKDAPTAEEDLEGIDEIEDVDESELEGEIEEELEEDLETVLDDEEVFVEEEEEESDEEGDYDDDEDDDDDHDEETAEALEELENQELQLLDDEANEAMLVDEVAELRAMRREELTMNVDAQSQKADEFVCQSCFMVKRTSQLANKRKMICFDCVD